MRDLPMATMTDADVEELLRSCLTASIIRKDRLTGGALPLFSNEIGGHLELSLAVRTTRSDHPVQNSAPCPHIPLLSPQHMCSFNLPQIYSFPPNRSVRIQLMV